MRKIQPWTAEQAIAHNLRDGGTAYTVFFDAQQGRVLKARSMITELLLDCPMRARIIEPGCSAGDISGWFAERHDVTGYDVTPAAAAAARARYPDMDVIEVAIEDVEPQPCDILVLCEFLEHIADPIAFVQAWMPKARFVIIGHPLVGNGHDPEEGHVWAYDALDFDAWFVLGGHVAGQAWTFPMAGYHMVIGWGRRA